MFTCPFDSDEREEISSGNVNALVTVDNVSSFDVNLLGLVDLRSMRIFDDASLAVTGIFFSHSTKTVEESGISKYTGILGLHSTTTVEESVISGVTGTLFNQAIICLNKLILTLIKRQPHSMQFNFWKNYTE